MAGKKKEGKEKPLEKMTATDLRAIAKEVQGITGVHGMNKDELISAIKEARGIKETARKAGSSMRDIKAKIKEFKTQHAAALESDDSRRAAILRRRISRLKKLTRRSS
ncbi:MAG: Rho termination factor N-terminal domain-containing protein [Desulfobacterales bacterium]